MAAKLLVVLGATGNQGGSVIEVFSKNPEWRIRGLTRNVHSEASKALIGLGVEMVTANFDDVSSLSSAFRGANTIFGLTDFWPPVFDPTTYSELPPGRSVLEVAYERDYQNAKNVFKAAAETSGLERLIYSDFADVSKLTNGKYKHVYHFESTARAVEYAREHYPDLIKKTSFLKMGMFLSNMLLMPLYSPKKEENGVYTFRTKIKYSALVPMVSPQDDCGPLVKALFEAEPGKNVQGFRELLPFGEYVNIWGKCLNVPAKYIEVKEDDVWPGMPEIAKLDLEEGIAYLNEYGFAGGDPTTITPKELDKSLDLGTVEGWIMNQDWSEVLQKA